MMSLGPFNLFGTTAVAVDMSVLVCRSFAHGSRGVVAGAIFLPQLTGPCAAYVPRSLQRVPAEGPDWIGVELGDVKYRTRLLVWKRRQSNSMPGLNGSIALCTTALPIRMQALHSQLQTVL